jgi:hypothetical protein
VFRREIPMPICPQVSDLIDTDGVTNWRPFTLADGGVGTDVVFAVLFGLVEFWRALGDSNPCYRRERAVS